jgi:hypothetical protein
MSGVADMDLIVVSCFRLALLRLPTTTLDRIRGRSVSTRWLSVSEQLVLRSSLLLASTIREFLDVLAIFDGLNMETYWGMRKIVCIMTRTIAHVSSSRPSL